MSDVVAGWSGDCPGCKSPGAIFQVYDNNTVWAKCPKCNGTHELIDNEGLINWEKFERGTASKTSTANYLRKPRVTRPKSY